MNEQFPDEIMLTKLLPRIPTRDLLKLCQTNQKFNKIGHDQGLWLIKCKKYIPDTFKYFKNDSQTWRDFYLSNIIKSVDIFYNGNRMTYQIYLDDIIRDLKNIFQDYKHFSGLFLVDEFLSPILMVCRNNPLIKNFNHQKNIFDMKAIVAFGNEKKISVDIYNEGQPKPNNKNIDVRDDKIYKTIISSIYNNVTGKFPIGFNTENGLYITIPSDDHRHRRPPVPFNNMNIKDLIKLLSYIDIDIELPKVNIHDNNNLIDELIRQGYSDNDLDLLNKLSRVDRRKICAIIYDYLVDNNLMFYKIPITMNYPLTVRY